MRANDRSLEQDLLECMREYADDTEILEYIMGWLNCDDTCNSLKAMLVEWELEEEFEERWGE